MKKMSVVLGLLLAVLVMGCGIYESYGFDYKQLSSIERGMSFKEVCTILGEPAFRDLNKEGEAWTFRAYTPAGWSAVKVWFKDGKVDEMRAIWRILIRLPLRGTKVSWTRKRIFRQE